MPVQATKPVRSLLPIGRQIIVQIDDKIPRQRYILADQDILPLARPPLQDIQSIEAHYGMAVFVMG
jgi:hypothetical protein